MAPSLGREWQVPGSATQNGLVPGGQDPSGGTANRDRFIEMRDHMKYHPALGGTKPIEMQRFWHPRMSWYGPASIARGI